jgi:hypothetical protein
VSGKKIPENKSLVYYVALVGAAAIGVVDWPVVVAVAVGHHLARSNKKPVREVGEALEKA